MHKKRWSKLDCSVLVGCGWGEWVCWDQCWSAAAGRKDLRHGAAAEFLSWPTWRQSVINLSLVINLLLAVGWVGGVWGGPSVKGSDHPDAPQEVIPACGASHFIIHLSKCGTLPLLNSRTVQCWHSPANAAASCLDLPLQGAARSLHRLIGIFLFHIILSSIFTSSYAAYILSAPIIAENSLIKYFILMDCCMFYYRD